MSNLKLVLMAVEECSTSQRVCSVCAPLRATRKHRVKTG